MTTTTTFVTLRRSSGNSASCQRSYDVKSSAHCMQYWTLNTWIDSLTIRTPAKPDICFSAALEFQVGKPRLTMATEVNLYARG